MMRSNSQRYIPSFIFGIILVLLGKSIVAQEVQLVSSRTFVAVPNHPTVLWREPINNPTAIKESIVSKPKVKPAKARTEIPSNASPLKSNIAEPTIHRQNLDMFMGEVRVLTKKKIQRVAIGKGAVLRADVLDSGELLVIAESAGSSSLRLWFEDDTQTDYNIRVSETDPETRFRMEKMVRMRVRMIEFRKSALTRLGIDWADTLTGPTVSAAGDVVSNSLFRPEFEGFQNLPLGVEPVSTYFGIASNLTSRINAMATNGDARILAEPVLSGTNGGKASFLAGGEVPYPTVTSTGESVVDFKEYGIRLEVQPRIDTGGNVRATIQTEISQLDPAVTIQGAPGLLTRRASTEVNVRSGQTIVISGLLSSESSNDINRLPGIGRLPIFGRLFRSDNIRNNVSELVIFITPEVMDPAGNLLSERDAEFYDSAEQLATDTHGLLNLSN